MLIPIHQFLLNPCFQKYFPSMLNCISAGLLLYLVGYTMLVIPGIWGVIISSDTHRYLSCLEIPPRAAMWPDYYIPWYWKLGPYLIYGTGRTLFYVVFLTIFNCTNTREDERAWYWLDVGSLSLLYQNGNGTYHSLCVMMCQQWFPNVVQVT